MKPERLLRAILPDVLIDNFDIVNFDKSADRFDIYLDEKKVQLKEDKTNPENPLTQIFFSIRDLIFKVITKQEDCHYL